MYQLIFICILIAGLLPLFLSNKFAIQKLKNHEPIKGFITFNEAITLQTKLNKVEISILGDCLQIKGKDQNYKISFDEISQLKLLSLYSNIFKAAVVEIKFQNNVILVAATSFTLFDNFVVGRRYATIAIYELLTSLCKNLIKGDYEK